MTPDNALNKSSVDPNEQGSTGSEDAVIADDPRQTWIVYTDSDGKPHRVKTETYFGMER